MMGVVAADAEVLEPAAVSDAGRFSFGDVGNIVTGAAADRVTILGHLIHATRQLWVSIRPADHGLD